MPLAAPQAAHSMHAPAVQGRLGSSPHAAQQHQAQQHQAQQHQAELRQRAAASSRSQQQPSWTNYAAVSAFAAESCEPHIVRTNSGGSSGSGSSSSSTFAASRQQQQMMQMSMQSEVFAGREAQARPAAAAVDAVQQHKQHMAALQVIEDEITYLVRLAGGWGSVFSMLRSSAC
jgi:Na+-transporting NADH:ubiquinone oxidoreductase subunit NqrC